MKKDIEIQRGYSYELKFTISDDNFYFIKVRLLFFDEFEVFYEPYIPESGWLYSKRRTFSFSRMEREFFVNAIIGEIGTSQDLYPSDSLIRPDLPIRFARLKNISWGDRQLDSIQTINSLLVNSGFNNLEYKFLKSEKVYLHPAGKTGTFKSGVLVESAKEEGFAISDIVWQANNVQKNIESKYINGIGIYRSGVKNRIPSFILGEYYDPANIMTAID
jgi:hypothetical protein